MSDTKTVDEVVSNRTPSRGGGLAARPVENESVAASGGVAKIDRSGIEEETHNGGGRRARVFKDSTTKLLEKIEKEDQDASSIPAHEEGDPDEDEGVAAGDDAADGEDAGDAGDDAGGDEDDHGEDGGDAAPAGEEPAQPSAEHLAAVARLETRNRELIAELEEARKTPKAQRTERETALLAAEASYFDDGSVPGLRKFIGAIIGAAADSKEVDAELSGLYTDLTARELGVALDQNQQTLRDNARTRLLLARDKREKAEAEKKPAVDNSVEAVQYENAARYVDNLLVTKGQSGTSIADEYPLLMGLAQDFDGYAPAEVLARAIRQEIMTGTLDPKTSDADMIRIVAPKIEKHYDAVAQRIEAARAKKTKNPDTTAPSGKSPKAAVEAGKEQRQSQGARTITNAAASRAPATTPKKPITQKAKTTEKKTRKDFPSDAAWKDYLLDRHFES